MGKKGGGGDNRGADMREFMRQQRIQQGTAEIDNIFNSQFNEDFFNKRRQSALDYYMPQLENQFSDARKQLIFGLARSGGSDSSAAEQMMGDLQRRYNLNRQSISDRALSFETGARNNIEDARSQLLQMLNSTGDAQGAVNSARARLSALSAPDSYSPLADLFSTGASTLAQSLAQQRAEQMANSFGLSGVKPNPLGVRDAVSVS